MMREHDTLLISFGSLILTDSGVALRIAARLKSDELDADFLELAHGGLDMLPGLAGYSKVIFIDVLAESEVGNPRVNIFDRHESRYLRNLGGIHFETLEEVISTGIQLGYEMPQDILLVGINTDDDLSFGEELTKNLQSDFLDIMDAIWAIILA